ncbi:MAG TPA: nucleotide exchange factor GrpE [Candidatus Limnocylindrales bacterium]|jgi:molecular chaperone GrpE
MGRSGATEELPGVEELVSLLRQERADFRNFRHRVSAEREAEVDRLRSGLLEPLLPVIEDLDRALGDVPSHLADDPWVQGVGLARSRLGDLQEQLGLEPVGAVGEPFDPTRHEAVIYEPDPHAAEATLGQIIRPGYAARGRLLRPAQVVVRGPVPRGGEPPDSPPASTEPTGG